MEQKIHFLRKKLLWASVMVQIVMLASATNLTTTEIPPQVIESQIAEEIKVDGYAWSSWGSWSPCSRSCGGGVSVQERQCLPRTRSPVGNSSIAQPVIKVRVTRQIQEDNCQGVDKRYHECNNIPCPSGSRNTRAEQCSTYDRRPFRGRFYTWVPYINAQSNQSINQTTKKPTKPNLRWKKKSLQLNAEQLRFKGNKNLGTELLELETPIQFFFYLFPQELIQMISEETNLYQVQNDPNSTFRVTEMDIRQFMGNSPCMLNCRPLGHHFYASLGLVADGTPCTRQGSRAICIQGTCKDARSHAQNTQNDLKYN
ncbi:unnamed protein product [Arctia plantaginis]|uniref:Uncharacterized protein n=1 Tax=Arctia plantaginis TaxID=874455 RepID=A0A8S1BEI9_ARCPL|nr:unnamed protein product [Arctia plantaginis]